MDVSVIIVNYNTLELTKNTINSIIEKTEGLDYEIILVDNASTDGSIDFFEKEYKNKIIFIKNNENLGFGRANNKGIEISKGKYVFLLNSDTLLINNAIKILFDFMEKNNNCGVCGGNLYTKDLKPSFSFFEEIPYITLKTEIDVYLNIFKRLFEKITNKKNNFNYDIISKKVGAISGADMMIRRKVLEKVGFFDSDFFMYAEEIELTYRIFKAGYLSFSVPNSKIIHLEGQSPSFKETKFRMGLESKYKYFYKTSNLRTCKYAYFISQIGHIIRLILSMNSEYIKKLRIKKEEYNNLRRN